jgi:hypothetical protein
MLNTRQKNRMPSQAFAFPRERKEPLNDASHVRNAVARFAQVKGVSDSERDAAWRASVRPPESTASRSRRSALPDEGPHHRQISRQSQPVGSAPLGLVAPVFNLSPAVAAV